jgi:hypothetical protein
MSNLSDYKLTISTNDDLSLTGNISANNITVSTDLLVQGDLNVTGTQTITNTTTLAVNDNKITLNSGASGTPSLNASVLIDRGSSSNVDLRWNETTDKWQQTRDGSTYVDIPINTTELSEGTNQYFTNARARAAISVTGSGSYDNGTGVITVTGGVTSVNTLTGAVTLSTTNIAEGTNLYYTDSRANTAFDARLAAKTTSNVAEGTNLYYTNARANSAMAAFTGNLTAGNASLGNLTTSNYFAGTLTTAAQPNITSTGTLTSLTVTGNVTGGNIVSGGVANITGNITGANLIAGSSGAGNVYAGNVIVNGQPTTYGVVNPQYISVTNNTPQNIANVSAGGTTLTWDTALSSNGITYSAGGFALTAGLTYQIQAEISLAGYTGYMIVHLVDTSNNSQIGSPQQATIVSTNAGFGEANNGSLDFIYTPSANQTVAFRVVSGSANITGQHRGTGFSRASIVQINPTIAVQATATGTVATNYIATTRTGSGQSVTTNTDIILNTTDKSVGSSVSYNTSTGVYTLTAGTTYELSFTPNWSFSGSNNDPYVQYDWVDATTNTALDGDSGSFATAYSYNYNYAQQNQKIISQLVYTPSTNQTVKIRVTSVQAGGITTTLGVNSSAYVKAMNAIFALNALDTMTTTGNVSVGGNLTATGGIRKNARVLTTTTTLTVADASGFIELTPGGGPYTITLPNPTLAANSGIGYRFWQNTTDNITLSTPAGAFYGPSGSNTNTKVLAQATTQYWDVWSDGYNWTVFGIKIA